MKNSYLSKMLLTGAVAALTACAGTGYERQATRAEPELRAEEDITAAGNRVDRAVAREQAAYAPQPVAGSSTAVLTGQHKQARCCPRAPVEPVNRENYASYDNNPVKLARIDPVSTFSIDVDTGSYSNVRRFLGDGQLPPQDAVRVEELINYFSYNYPAPDTPDTPFSVITEVAPTPWNPDSLLMHIGLKGFEVPANERPPANLVFLVDVSGSMRSPDKLPLLKDALQLLTRNLEARDSVAIAGYAGGAGVILEPTSGADKARIMAALDNLTAAGRTNGAAGIHLAYDMARRGFVEGGINRVILATDGDFNVGTVNFEALVNLVEEKRRNGVALTALGFGSGNFNDKLLEQIADAGNGNYAYIDSRREARKVLVEEMSSTLQIIARDVKIQVEFNPDVVAEYRLVGYENRMLRREDFNNDQIDAGEIGAGHTVTALYEVTLKGSPAQLNEPLRYAPASGTPDMLNEELAFVRLRYKQPDGDHSSLIETPVSHNQMTRMHRDFRFAAAVAAFGQRLRGGDYLNGFELEAIAALAAGSTGRDRNGYRTEFVELVERAIELSGRTAALEVDGHVYRVAN
ncbi:MAG: VWA domain-containing protein [Gammaproteobacteria bacterium]|nr:VWA domain-containing protein [Gammaproteobacteria bacterium]NNF60804.1 VWA domain-containing protein [Gammaproteobacteria bacterium]NNM21731.1 VWA domain-containing protein [Gammaproteobacteria bacterium]